MVATFSRYIGIDYSGAAMPDSRLSGLRVYAAGTGAAPCEVRLSGQAARHWTRREVAEYCRQALVSDGPVIIGIDHAFSFPWRYFEQYGLANWDDFLDDFVRYWPTHERGVTVRSLRDNNPRSGQPGEFRLCEQWTAGARSVFQFDVQGTVANSSHAGIPWLRDLRRDPALTGRVHFWPFDGFEVPRGWSVVVEAYPALYKRRYRRGERTPDQYDAWATACWLRDMDARGVLSRYFQPPLTAGEANCAACEGWILGVG